jgi:hypothetical protein
MWATSAAAQGQQAGSDVGAIFAWQQRAQRSYGLSPDPHTAALEHSSAIAMPSWQAAAQKLAAQTPLLVGPPQNLQASLRTASCDAERCVMLPGIVQDNIGIKFCLCTVCTAWSLVCSCTNNACKAESAVAASCAPF